MSGDPTVVVHVSNRIRPFQVDTFPPKAKRSRKGALHLKPGATLVITEDELRHLELAHKGVILAVNRRAPSPDKAEAKPSPDKAEAKPEPEKAKPEHGKPQADKKSAKDK